MGWLRRNKPYDRSRILTEAARAHKKKKYQKAIALYRQVLEVEPENHELHRKVAPLLAETRQEAEAWASYRRAAEGLVRRGFLDQAIGVLREASGYLRRRAEVWWALADLEIKRRRPVDAHKVLIEGRRHLRSKKERPQAIQLLLRARKLVPHDFETDYDLVGLLARSGERTRAGRLLGELAATARGGQLRRVRARQFGLSPTPVTAWRWLRALFGGN